MNVPSDLHEIGCLGKITSFKETEDGRYIIEIKGLIRFKIIQEIKSSNLIGYMKSILMNFDHDLSEKKED